MSKANHKFGPAANWSELAEDLDDEHRLFSMPFDDVLVYYDGPIISVGQFKNDPDKSFYLRISASLSSTPDGPEYPRQMESVTHYLEFPSREDVDATLHDKTVPTLESYRQATSILREVCSWTLLGAGQSENCTVTISDVSKDAVPVAELPYAHLKPGNVMSFVAAGHEELRKACTPHYVYPLPIKQALVFHDYTRCWIGTTTLVGTKKFHLNWNINDRGGHKINHRLTFDSPEAMRSTLYHGYVATRETYDKALEIARETLTVVDGNWTLKVETLDRAEVPDDELPGSDLKACPKPG